MTSREEFENWIFINSHWIITQAEKIIRDLDEFGPAEKTYGELKVGDIFILPYSMGDYWLDKGVFKMKIILILDLFEDDGIGGDEEIAHYYNWTIETRKGLGVAFKEPLFPEPLPQYQGYYGDINNFVFKEKKEEMKYKYVESDKYSITHFSMWQEDEAQDVLEYVLNVTEGGIIITNINKMPVPFLNWEIDEPWEVKE
tara:strand:- start:78 stop:674 length:597 start_codon:yes stop_codon:yes gene_type:complete